MCNCIHELLNVFENPAQRMHTIHNHEKLKPMALAIIGLHFMMEDKVFCGIITFPKAGVCFVSMFPRK